MVENYTNLWFVAELLNKIQLNVVVEENICTGSRPFLNAPALKKYIAPKQSTQIYIYMNNDPNPSSFNHQLVWFRYVDSFSLYVCMVRSKLKCRCGIHS